MISYSLYLLLHRTLWNELKSFQSAKPGGFLLSMQVSKEKTQLFDNLCIWVVYPKADLLYD